MRLPPARTTIGLVATTVLAFVIGEASGGVDAVAAVAGFVPARVGHAASVVDGVRVALSPLSATLVHANPTHLLFNMLMLGFCGRYVEASLGGGGLLALYLVGAYGAAAAEFAVAPHSTVPMVGASGAASAVIGAYAILYGGRQAKGWGPRSGRALQVLWLAIAWIGLQFLIGMTGAGLPGLPTGTGVAVVAHVGGFLVGLLLARPLLLFRYRGA